MNKHFSDSDDYSLNKQVFGMINRVWGPFTVDRFASHLTKQVSAFNSRWWNPGSQAMDAFSQVWTHGINWIFPPPRLISRILTHMKLQKSCGTLLIPFWPSAFWWNILFKSPFVLMNNVLNWSDIHPGYGLFTPAPVGNRIFSDNPVNFRILVIRLCFCNSCRPYPPIQNKCINKICHLPFENL
jgi:hypothetical protein